MSSEHEGLEQRAESESKLLPCPFCGDEATVLNIQFEKYGVVQYYVDCDNGRCPARIYAQIDRATAIRCWNTRVENESLKTQIERLVDACARAGVDDHPFIEAVIEDIYPAAEKENQ